MKDEESPQTPVLQPATTEQPAVEPAPFALASEKKSSKRLWVLISIITAALLAAAAVALYVWPGYLKQQPPTNQQSTGGQAQQQSEQPQTQPEPVTPHPIGIKSGPTIIYTYLDTQGDDKGEQYFIKMGSNPAISLHDILGDVGNVYQVQLSPNKKQLILGVGLKVGLLDIGKGTLKYVFTAKHGVESLAWSPDGSEILVWDHGSGGSGTYRLVRLDLATGKETTVLSTMRNVSISNAGFEAWRSDDKVLMGQTRESDYYSLYIIDLNKGTMEKAPVELGYPRSAINSDGTLLASPSGNVEDTCDNFGGSGTTSLTIVNPLTGALVSKLTVTGKSIADFTFSADNKELLFTTAKVGVGDVSDATCESYLVHKSYSIFNLESKVVTPVTDLMSLLKSWDSRTLLADVLDSSPGQRIVINGKTVVDHKTNLFVLVQYYQK